MTDERRTEKRFLLHSPVKVTGVDEGGLQFAERSSLEDIGEIGCRFSLRNAVGAGVILGVEPLGDDGENLPDEFPRLFKVIWVKRKGVHMTLGARSLREDELSDAGVHAICPASETSAK